MKIGKLIKILDAEEALQQLENRSRGMVTVSTELLQDSALDLRHYLRTAFARALARQVDNAWQKKEAKRKSRQVTHYVGDGCCDFCGGHGQNCRVCDNRGRDEKRK
jgi:post-segregation antitoxin (ccd killing protein)